MDESELKELLNDQQYKAVMQTDGPVLVLAGAGSGKTRILTYRIAYLVSVKRVKPWNILAITFTNKAAGEMYDRIQSLLEADTSGMWINTFHAACGKILRKYGDIIGFNHNFVIYDESESISVIKECQKRLNVDDKYMPYKKIRSVISHCKDEMITHEDYAKSIDQKNKEDRLMSSFYTMYQETLLKNNAMDFDDMIINTIRLFKADPDVLEYYRHKFEYILVDEYQDTNKAQYIFINMLAESNRNLCVVGDDDQSIYSFRGADINNILGFEKKYPECAVIKLEQNYRSTQSILDCANNVIKMNSERKEKHLWTSKGEGDPVVHYIAEDQRDEAHLVSKEIIESVKKKGMKYSDFAVLYRTNVLSKAVEDELVRYGVPYRVYGGLRYYERKEVKDLLCYLRVINNISDEVSLKRIINVPKRGIGATTVGYATEIAEKSGDSLFNVLLNSDEHAKLSKASKKLIAFTSLILELMQQMDELSLPDYVQYIIDRTGILDEYKTENTEEAESRIENLKEFISVAREYEDERKKADSNVKIEFSEFLEHLSLSSDLDTMSTEEQNTVTLMTVHSSKGLEFNTVFVIGMEDGLFPSYRSIDSLSALSEERRLCYVAITRAKKRLYLINSYQRMLYGQTTYNTQSRFLRDIPEDDILTISYKGYVSYPAKKDDKGKVTKKPKMQAKTQTAPQIQRTVNSIDAEQVSTKMSVVIEKPTACGEVEIGVRVHHKRFGKGTVVKLLGEGDKKTAEIVFDESGMKRIILAYAMLTIIE